MTIITVYVDPNSLNIFQCIVYVQTQHKQKVQTVTRARDKTWIQQPKELRNRGNVTSFDGI